MDVNQHKEDAVFELGKLVKVKNRLKVYFTGAKKKFKTKFLQQKRDLETEVNELQDEGLSLEEAQNKVLITHVARLEAIVNMGWDAAKIAQEELEL